MRLKGGKVLLDLSDWDFASNYSKDIDSATGKAIIQKGLTILIKEIVNHVIVAVDLSIKEIDDSEILYRTIFNNDGDEFLIYFGYDSEYAGTLLTLKQ